MWLTLQLVLVQLLNLVPLLHTALQKAATTAFQPHIADRIVFPNLHGRAHDRGRVPQLNLHCHLRELRRTPCRLDRRNTRIVSVVGDDDGVSIAAAGVAVQDLSKNVYQPCETVQPNGTFAYLNCAIEVSHFASLRKQLMGAAVPG